MEGAVIVTQIVCQLPQIEPGILASAKFKAWLARGSWKKTASSKAVRISELSSFMFREGGYRALTFPCFTSGVTFAWQGINNKWNCGNRKNRIKMLALLAEGGSVPDEFYRVLSE